jgi:hypothetical protein
LALDLPSPQKNVFVSYTFCVCKSGVEVVEVVDDGKGVKDPEGDKGEVLNPFNCIAACGVGE